MKTPREILLSKHQGVEPSLDVLREQFVAGIAKSPAESKRSRSDGLPALEGQGWREIILLFRWHLAGWATVWIVVALLQTAAGTVETSRVAQHKATSPSPVILTLKENRRQILEFGALPSALTPPGLPVVPQSRRSLRQMDWAYS